MERAVVVGLGYVGLTLAVALAERRIPVIGVEIDPLRARRLRRGESPFYEEGMAEALAKVAGDGFLSIAERLPILQAEDVIVVCVGTQVDPQGLPQLDGLLQALDSVGRNLPAGALVVVRSTVAVGTVREKVYPTLRRYVEAPALAYCPERMIQGTALREIAALPQIVAGIDDASRDRAARFFARVTPYIESVSALEIAELAKLANNAHTDMLYAFGNQLAFICDRYGVAVDEVLRAANTNYPRPRLHGPGYVGGSCLTKDPYYLLLDEKLAGLPLGLIRAARQANDALPVHLVERAAAGWRAGDGEVLLCGCAYKGRPVTDDVRGSAAAHAARLLRDRGLPMIAHDFVVPAETIEQHIGQPVTWEDGLRRAGVILFLNDHEGYSRASLNALDHSRSVRIYDIWGVLAQRKRDMHAGVLYYRFGYGAT